MERDAGGPADASDENEEGEHDMTMREGETVTLRGTCETGMEMKWCWRWC